MVSKPQTAGRPQIKLQFDLLGTRDWGHLFKSFEFKGMVNGGYIVRAALFDPSYNLLKELTETGYFQRARVNPLRVTWQILAGPNEVAPEKATFPQIGIVLSLETIAGPPDTANLEFIAIDPPSWFLNMGDAAGIVFRGRVDQVIRQVVNRYAPEIAVEVGRTTDSENNKFWMMRQDPKTFLSSLLDWSSAITLRKTQWLVEADGNNLSIREQGLIPSRQRAFYRYFDGKVGEGQGIDTISKAKIIADNALSLIQTKLVTQGLSAISGQFLDRITDNTERQVFVKDSRTATKQIASATSRSSFTKPPDGGPPDVGWSAISAIPEIYSAGELGAGYGEYIDGRPRALWLNLVNALLRVKFTVLGHGEWSNTNGLGVDTIFVRWSTARSSEESSQYWWLTGNWLVYGFNHRVNRQRWITDLYTARFDWDSAATKVGGTT